MDNCHYQTSLREAITMILDRDIPEAYFSNAVTFQASLLARIDPEEIHGMFQKHLSD